MEQADNNKTASSAQVVIAGLIGACLLIYAQVVWFEFINFDDNFYVYENPYVAAGLNLVSLKWAFTAFHSANWHPLTWISHMIDSTAFGPYAGGHHAVNVIFHAINSVLAFVVFRRMTGEIWTSALVAFLFAVHPAHVESVAWISERKDVLSTMFWLLTMLFYVRFAQSDRGDAPVGRRLMSVSLIVATVFFALGLMSKPMLVTLPFVLLLCDYWPLGRLKTVKDVLPLIVEKLPLFILSGVSAYITVQAQEFFGAIQSTQVLPFDVRLMNAAISYAKYLIMLVYPANLGVGYAYRFPFPVWQVIGSIILLLAITVFCVWQRRERKYLLVGWLWFIGTMIPVIGLVQVGAQSMADRYTYVPYFGLFIMIVWSAAELIPRLKLNFTSAAVAAAVPILILAVVAFNQTAQWKNSITLYSHTLNAGQGNFLTMHNLCSALAVQNRFAEAEVHCRNGIASDPGFADSHVLLGVITMATGRYEESVNEFKRALEIDPNNVMAHGNLSAPLGLLGRPEEAEQTLDRAVELHRRNGTDPRKLADFYGKVAAVYAGQKRFDRAYALLHRMLEMDPARADARANLALTLYLLDKIPEARAEIDQSIEQAPNVAESYNIRGLILQKQGDSDGALAAFERALQLKPDFKDAKDNLEKAKNSTRAGK